MAKEGLQTILEYIANQKLKWAFVALIAFTLFIGLKWIAPNPDSTSSEEQHEQTELQEEETEGEAPVQPASRGEVAGKSNPEPEQEEPAIFVDITSVISDGAPVTEVPRGSNVILTAKTLPDATCDVTVYYESGPSKARGLEDKPADGNGNVSWTWKVETGTVSEPRNDQERLIVVTCSLRGKTASAEKSFIVKFLLYRVQ